MKIKNIRDILALSIVGIYLIGSLFFLLLPVIKGLPIKSENIEYLKTFNNIYTGIIGLILGYYFGKKEE